MDDFCDNARMSTSPLQTTPNQSPLLHEENGELSLHFNFPTIQSRMLKADPERLVLDYTRTMMGFLLFNPQPQRIAMIGLGGGSLAKYCRRKLPESQFIAVELSQEIIGLRDQFDIPPDDALFSILCADGADYVHGESESLDVLLVDGFDSGGQPERLCSAVFYDDCHAALRAGGILVVNLCADDTGYGSYVNRIGDAFDGKMAVVEAEEGDNKIVFSCKGGNFPLNFSELTERLRQLESTHPVGLDRTAQMLLRRKEARGNGNPRKKRR